MNLDVSIEDFCDAHLEPLFALFGSYFKPDDRLLTASYTRWLYARNPFGPARMVKVVEGERWVGFMAMIPVKLGRSGESQQAFYVVNVLVHPEFHGKNLFGRMIEAAMVQVEAEGAALMGHPNDMALKAWQRARMHFHEPLSPSLALPFSWGSGIKSRMALSAADLAPQREALNEAVQQHPWWRVAATPQYLTWRYLEHPTNRYQVQCLEAKGVAKGVQITKRIKPGLNLLVDQFVHPSGTQAATSKLPLLTVCFLPGLAKADASTARWSLPLKKRIPFFLTRPSAPVNAIDAARIGLSASDF